MKYQEISRISVMNLLRASGCIVFAFCCIVDGSKPHRMHLNGTGTGHHQGIHQRRDFFRKLIVTTILEQPYMMLKPNSPYLAGNDRFEGYLADILMKLSTSAGFEYEIRLAKDGRYGELNTNGQWDGMIGEVLTGDADIAAGAIIVTDGKRDFVDFTESFLSLRSSALIRIPKSKRRPQRIGTVEQLLASGITFGVVEDSVAYRILQASNDPLKTMLWQQMKAFQNNAVVFGAQEGIDKARREDYAFILDSPMAEYVATRRPCDLYATEPFLDFMTYAFAMRRDDSRLRIVIDSELKKMKLSDEMQTMYLRWWRNECDDQAIKTDLEETTERKRNTVERKPAAVVSNPVTQSSSGRVIQPLLITTVCLFALARTATS